MQRCTDYAPSCGTFNLFRKFGYDSSSGEYNVQTTLRGVLSDEEVQAHLETVIRGLTAVTKLGGKPSAKYASNGATSTANGQPERTIVIEELVATDYKGKTYVRAKGKPFSKHGIDLWPEPLIEAGLVADAEDFQARAGRPDFEQMLKAKVVTSREEYEAKFPGLPDLTGWSAEYSMKPAKQDPANPDPSLKPVPDKIVKLYPPK